MTDLRLCLLLLVSISSIAKGDRYADELRRDKPIAYFSFDSAIADSVGRSKVTNHGAVTGPGSALLTVRKSNKSARFDGKTWFEATARPDVFEFSGAMSIEFWIRPAAGGQHTQCFISKGVYTETNCQYYVVYFQDRSGKSGRLRFGFGSGQLDQSSALPENRFTHVVITYSGSSPGNNARMYINGKLDAEGHVGGKQHVSRGKPLTIGALNYQKKSPQLIQHLVGELDELAFYDKVLKEGQVARHYAASQTELVFEQSVRPIFRRACLGCHADKPDGKLDLRRVSAMLRGGANGPAIVPGNPEQSLLIERVHHREMPPADSGEKLSQTEKRLIRRWVAGGCLTKEKIDPAKFKPPTLHSGHWAFQPFRPKPRPPQVRSRDRVGTPIDAFIQARLERAGISMLGSADRTRLARRLYVDLWGLPPTPEQVAALVNDQRPDAVERCIDRLLSSPQFGIRWGRHWLDIAGYTDTISFDDDYGPPIGFVNGKWKYRDYVIEAFNNDKPYARFLTEQLAGDEMVTWRGAKKYTKSITDHLVATGFLRCCEDISKEDPRPFIIWSVLHDSVEQIGTSILGLTLNCSRCHTHKFEPIPQTDYYSLMALLTPALNPANWRNPQQRAVPDVAQPKIANMNRWNAKITQEVMRLQKRIGVLREPARLRIIAGRLTKANVPAQRRAAILAAIKQDTKKQTPQQKSLLAKHAMLVKVNAQQIAGELNAAEKKAIAVEERKIAAQNTRRKSHDWIHAVYDVGRPPATHLFRRGTYLNPRRQVAPGFLSVLTRDAKSWFKTVKPTTGSGRRLALAKWLTAERSPASALVARVMVNRVWGHLLGEPLVKTVDNLGVSGAKPTHPQLLEWLAADFRHHGSIKRLVRMIVRSSVYQQASFASESAMARGREVDPENRLLWRARLRRVEAEVIRDSMLAVAGQLTLSMGGPPVPLTYKPNGTILVGQGAGSFRRTVYLLNRRIYNPSFLSVFDKPIVTGSTCKRDKSAVALQSLSMMNDTFVVDRSLALAQRVFREAGGDGNARIRRLYRLTIARLPSASELRLCRQMLKRHEVLHKQDAKNKSTQQGNRVPLQAFADLCHTILNLNEFLYLE